MSDKIKIRLDDETRPVLEAVQRAKEEVASWPAWKRRTCIPGCLCAPEHYYWCECEIDPTKVCRRCGLARDHAGQKHTFSSKAEGL